MVLEFNAARNVRLEALQPSHESDWACLLCAVMIEGDEITPFLMPNTPFKLRQFHNITLTLQIPGIRGGMTLAVDAPEMSFKIFSGRNEAFLDTGVSVRSANATLACKH